MKQSWLSLLIVGILMASQASAVAAGSDGGSTSPTRPVPQHSQRQLGEPFRDGLVFPASDPTQVGPDILHDEDHNRLRDLEQELAEEIQVNMPKTSFKDGGPEIRMPKSESEKQKVRKITVQ